MNRAWGDLNGDTGERLDRYLRLLADLNSDTKWGSPLRLRVKSGDASAEVLRFHVKREPNGINSMIPLPGPTGRRMTTHPSGVARISRGYGATRQTDYQFDKEGEIESLEVVLGKVWKGCKPTHKLELIVTPPHFHLMDIEGRTATVDVERVFRETDRPFAIRVRDFNDLCKAVRPLTQVASVLVLDRHLGVGVVVAEAKNGPCGIPFAAARSYWRVRRLQTVQTVMRPVFDAHNRITLETGVPWMTYATKNIDVTTMKIMNDAFKESGAEFRRKMSMPQPG